MGDAPRVGPQTVAKRAPRGLSFEKPSQAFRGGSVSMKNAKLILTALALLVAAIIVWTVVGFVFLAVKVLFVLMIVLFIATMIRKLSKKSSPRELEDKSPERELNDALRQIEEIKRSQQLVK
jgi:Flp pilus assembly protein TadB